MAEASPIQRPIREPRGGRRRPPAEHVGDRCTMCRRKVTVDAQGRCPLGHQVVPPEVVDDRAAARGEARDTTMRQAAGDSDSGSSDTRDEARDPSARIVATYVEMGQGVGASTGGWQRAAWSLTSPAVEPARAPRTIDLTTEAEADTGPVQPGGASVVQADPGLPRRSKAPATPPHGMSAMLPVMPADDAPGATAELIQVPDPQPDGAPAAEPDLSHRVDRPAEDAQATSSSPRVFEDPPPPLPLRDAQGHEVSDQAAAPAQSLPRRTRTPMVPQARSLFTEALGAEERRATPEEMATDQPPPGDHASVPLSDLTPSAPSALDVEDGLWSDGAASPGAASTSAAYEQEPLADPQLEPPRGIAQIVAGVLFVALLVMIAWYLATSL